MDLRTVAQIAVKEQRSFNYVLQRARIDDLLGQIEKLKPLLTHDNPEIPLKASQEIRDLHTQISEITKILAIVLPNRRCRKPKKRKSVVKREENVFRPPV